MRKNVCLAQCMFVCSVRERAVPLEVGTVRGATSSENIRTFDPSAS